MDIVIVRHCHCAIASSLLAPSSFVFDRPALVSTTRNRTLRVAAGTHQPNINNQTTV